MKAYALVLLVLVCGCMKTEQMGEIANKKPVILEGSEQPEHIRPVRVSIHVLSSWDGNIDKSVVRIIESLPGCSQGACKWDGDLGMLFVTIRAPDSTSTKQIVETIGMFDWVKKAELF